MTHINAFVQEFLEAKAKAGEGQGRLEAAEVALRAHPDFEESLLGDEEVEDVAEENTEVPVKVKKKQ
jgi:hypothetical protein